MKTNEDIVANWRPRYTDTSPDGFGKYILLTNFISFDPTRYRGSNEALVRRISQQHHERFRTGDGAVGNHSHHDGHHLVFGKHGDGRCSGLGGRIAEVLCRGRPD